MLFILLGQENKLTTMCQYHHPIQHNPTQSSTSSSLTSSTSDKSEKDKSAEHVHKPIVLFPNRLKNNNKQVAQMEKILEMFNQVKINVPLLNEIQQFPSYVKLFKDMCTKRRKINVSKKFFLTTNISKLLSGLISVKYKDLGCPTIACII